MKKTSTILDEIVEQYSAQLKTYYFMLCEVMPEYFFKTFTTEQQLKDVFPLLFALESGSGIQSSERSGRIIYVYLKEQNKQTLAGTNQVRGRYISGAVIHESIRPVTIGGSTGTLVIECFTLAEVSRAVTPEIFNTDDIIKFYSKKYGKTPGTLRELCSRLNWNQIADLSLERLVERLNLVLDVQDKDYVSVNFENTENNSYRLLVVCPGDVRRDSFFFKILDSINLFQLNVERAYWREFSHEALKTDFTRHTVTIASLYLVGKISSENISRLIKTLKVTYWTDFNDLFHRELVLKHKFTPYDANLFRSITEFLHGQFAFVNDSAYNAKDIQRFMAIYPGILKELLELFSRRFEPAVKRDQNKEASLMRRIEKSIQNINSGVPDKDALTRNIFCAALDFIKYVQKTNFYAENKSALAFRLNPLFMKYYENLSESYKKAFPADRPFGVFFFFRQYANGFQVRFAEIARGGWRTVIPRRGNNELEENDMYDAARDEIFREVFILAHTQHMKNKDIYEGGAKMITLLNMPEGADFQATLWETQRAIAAAFVSLINYDSKGKLRDKNIIDYLQSKEIIEIGPDENMFDPMIEFLGKYAAQNGYTLGSGLISGKTDGGISHKEFGVTSFGVHQFLLRTMNEIGINPKYDDFSIKISGGPFGDVAGNEMKLLLAREHGQFLYPKLKITAITDGPAAMYDPDGIDRHELERLVLKYNLNDFSPDKLSGEGAYIVYSQAVQNSGTEYYRQVIRHKGVLLEKHLTRDEFSRLFQGNLYNYADIFIPCGGRPSTINISNFNDYLPNGKPGFKAIVEGANSFITPEARIKLQDAGVLIVKDASANKCGVITSSYEILSGLMLTETEFKAVKKKLVPQVMDILAKRAQAEAEWLFAQHAATGRRLTELTDILSREINDKNIVVSSYLDKHPEIISDEIILSHLPPIFTEHYRNRINRIPPEYRKAIAAVELASRIVYSKSNALDNEIKRVTS